MNTSRNLPVHAPTRRVVLAMVVAVLSVSSLGQDDVRQETIRVGLQELKAIISELKTEEDQTKLKAASEHFLTIIFLSESDAWELYKSESGSGGVGLGSIQLNLSEAEFKREFRELKRRYYAAGDRDAVRKLFLNNNKESLSDAGRAVIEKYLELLDNIQRTPDRYLEGFFQLAVVAQTPSDAVLSLGWRDNPVAPLYGVKIKRTVVSGKTFDGEVDWLVNPYQFVVERPGSINEEAFSVVVHLTAHGFGDRVISVSTRVPPPERITKRIRMFESEAAKLRAELGYYKDREEELTREIEELRNRNKEMDLVVKGLTRELRRWQNARIVFHGFDWRRFNNGGDSNHATFTFNVRAKFGEVWRLDDFDKWKRDGNKGILTASDELDSGYLEVIPGE